MMPKRSLKNKAWVVDVSMGYGHQRTAYPLKDIAFGGILHADDYKGIPFFDKTIWKQSREFYESISKFKRIPLLGEMFFSSFDKLQKIDDYYPKKDRSVIPKLSQLSYKATEIGWGKDLIKRLSKYKIPFVSTFFTPAFMAEKYKYPGDIYIIVCDTDISRSWAPLNPKISRIKYFAPTNRVVDRLITYGVKKENIYLTGYPLPEKNLKDKTLTLLREDIKKRLINLDPDNTYFSKYKAHIEFHVGRLPKNSGRKLNLTFAVGGAGAQKELYIEIIKSLNDKIINRKIEINLIAGTNFDVYQYFKKELAEIGLKRYINKNIKILYAKEAETYFDKFNLILRRTDLLFTKPSELSFYSALGIPIVIMPTIGYQEKFNQSWLLNNGFGILPENLSATDQWLDDYLKAGLFADIAMQSFVENKQDATFAIKNIIFRKKR
jgi:hypothetical protein